MCGIVGILCSDNCAGMMYNGLEQLQNRGYDSAGITTISEQNNTSEFVTSKFATTEKENALSLLRSHINRHSGDSVGIGHTRWATHGMKVDLNSHPHTDTRNLFTLVHNGIIENYLPLRTMLIGHGYVFKSQTDSEVIVNLLSHLYHTTDTLNNNDVCEYNTKTFDNVIDTIQMVIKKASEMLQGTWALTIISTLTPNTIYVTRHGSPLLISYNDNLAIIVSEKSGFCNKVTKFSCLENNDVCVLTRDVSGGKVLCKTLDNCVYTSIDLARTRDTLILPSQYNHWMEKEIDEQEDAYLRALSLGGRILSTNEVKLGGLEEKKTELLECKHAIILGCGTSYFAGLMGKIYFEQMCNFKTVSCIDGAEFETRNIIDNRTAVFFLSQSGETRDLYRCIKIARDSGCVLVGIVNTVDSQIARNVDCGCYLNAGREVAVASTKSFTNQVAVLSLISCWFSQESFHHNKCTQIIHHVRNLPTHIHRVLNEESIDTTLDSWSKNYFKEQSSCFLVGKGVSLPICYEGSLKLKEVAYIHAEGYSASGLKHGPLALVTHNFPVILFVMDDAHYVKLDSAYEELIGRHGTMCIITNSQTFVNKMLQHDKRNMNNVLYIHEQSEYTAPIVMNICIQKLAYKIACVKGLNPDQPRNLAKVVTVE